MAVNIGPRIGIDGEVEFRREINNIIQQSKTLASEMKAVTSAFDKNEKSQEAVSAKSKVLNKQIDTQRQRVEKLSEGLAASAKEFGTADARTQKWQQAVHEATAALNKMTGQLDELGNETDEAGAKSITFGQLIKAHVISDVIIDGIKRLAGAAKDMAQTFVENAAAVRAETSQFKQTFGDFEAEATSALREISEESGVLVTRLQGAGTQIYSFAKASGATAAESMDMMTRSLTVAADSAAYYDRSLEETTESLRSFLKGNFENDAALGVSCTETTRNAQAMELFGQKYSALSEVQKQQTLLAMVEEANALSGAMGQAAREAAGWENVTGNLTEAWRQATAVLGEPILDTITPFVQTLSSGLMGVVDGTKTIGSLAQELTTAVGDIALRLMENIPSMLQAGGSIVASIVSGISTALPSLITSAQGIMSSLTSSLAANLPQMISSGIDALLNFSGGLKSGIGTLVDNGISMIKTLADGLIAALPDLIAKVPLIVSNIANIINENAPKLLLCAAEIIGKLVIGLIANIPTIVANLPQIIQAIVDVFFAFNWLSLGKNIITMLKNGISSMTAAAKAAAGNVTNSIKSAIQNLPNTLMNLGRNAISSMAGGIRGMLGSVGSAAGAIANAAINAITYMPRMFLDIARNTVSTLWQAFTTGDWNGVGANIINGIIGGIGSALGGLVNAALNAALSAFNAAKAALGIHSPSRLFRDEIGRMIPQGMAVGIEADAHKVADAAKQSAKDSVIAARDGLTEFKSGELRLINAMVATQDASMKATKRSISGGINLGGVNIVINPSPGMDENALAEKVALKIQALTQQKEAIW